MKMLRGKIFLFLLMLPALFVKAGTDISWTASPFNQKVFIENKGQFDGENGNSSKTLFGASQDGVKMYFTTNGLTYRRDELVPMSAQDEGRRIKKKKMKSIPHYFSMEWIGANPNAKIISEENVSFYYTYVNSSIKAKACKKIIYKNLYPNIDIEYSFPKDKQGIKYSIILHPGADVSLIKIKYSGAEKNSLDSEGNIVTESSFGKFTDHAPVTFYEHSKSEISSAFVLTGSEISFHLKNYDRNKTVIIDPWLTNPVFTGYNSAYDVNYDANGNVYAYGAGGPFQLVKFDNAGAIQWVFTAVGFGLNFGIYYYGDFAVDEVSGTSYLVEGWNYSGTGSRVFKVNTIGMQTGTFPGDPNFSEMSRVEYNRCINQIVIGGGGIPPTTNQAAILDTNMVNIIPVNILSTTESYHDIALLAIDNNSNFCYMATTLNGITTNLFDNVIVKCPIPNLIPLAFGPLPDGHRIGEVGSATYVNGNKSNNPGTGRPVNGINGMAVSPCWLYTYDSDSLKRWDKNTGTLINAIDVSPSLPTYGGIQTGGVSIQISWGGLSTDESDNIYVGVAASIKEYNTSLTLINTIALPDTVYDIKLGPNNKLYACGKSFVTEINTIPNNTAVNVTQTPDTSCIICDGTATASIAACGSFNYVWSTTPIQTTQTATGLCPGNYSVTLTTNCFTSFTGTVSVGFSGSITAVAGPTASICAGQSATLTASGGTNFLWNTGNTTTSIIINPTTTTNYSVIVSSGLCSDTASATVTVFSLPVVSVSGNANICIGDIATLTANGGNSYSWSNGSTVNSISVNPSSTTSYTVIATNTNGCTSSASATVTVSPQPIASATGATICSGQTATLIASGGTNYSWSTGGTTASIIANPTTTTNYSVIVSSGLCSDTASATVTVIPLPTVSVSGNTSICTGGIATLIATGGNSYSWSNGLTLNPISVNPSLTTTYTVVAANMNGCTAITTVIVTVYPPPIASANGTTICSGQTAALTASGGGTYSWSNGNTTNPVLVSPTSTSTYSVIVFIGSCSDTASATVTVNPSPTATAWSNVTIMQGQSTTLAASGGGTYLWSNGSTANPITVSPPIITIYCVTVTQSNCTDTACVTVTVEPIDCGYADEQLFVPDAFSPNNDTKNDVLGVYYPNISCIKDFMFIIYDRWGEKIFEASSIVSTWDGTYKGKLMNTAVFVYYMKVTLMNGEKIERKGNISLII